MDIIGAKVKHLTKFGDGTISELAYGVFHIPNANVACQAHTIAHMWILCAAPL